MEGGGEAIKRTQTLIVVAAVIIVIVAAGLGAMWVLRKNDRGGTDNSDYIIFWKPKVGKFVEYTQVNESFFNYNWTMKTTVLSVNDTSVMREEGWYDEAGYLVGGANWSAPINLTFGNGFDINYNMGWPVNVTEVGTENVTTPWGVRTCICYSAFWWISGCQEYFWVHNGVMVKDVIPPELGTQRGTWILTSTNIGEVTH
jgi:hypothetical protein